MACSEIQPETWFQLEISGLVQGVGFRPFVYSIAQRTQLTGRVFNAGKGVIIELLGSPRQISEFVGLLKSELPSLAKIDQIEQSQLSGALFPGASLNSQGFIIDQSQNSNSSSQVMPDLALCQSCLIELFDPDNFRFRYPLINCTHCGPRYSIIKSLPYDRAVTTMSEFTMCGTCATEYSDPLNRRFHAQPVACPQCGPQIQLLDSTGKQVECNDAISTAVQALRQGKILAIKGIGGFHLACDASNSSAIELLRQRKNRPNKPLAIMASNLNSLGAIVSINETSSQLLTSYQAPIVILPSKLRLPKSVAPNLQQLGVLLAYTPIHHLIFHELLGRPNGTDWLEIANDEYLVMTSANKPGNPLIADNAQALVELADIADYFLLHNRDILLRGDDSIINACGKKPITIRRSRGMAPEKIALVQPANNTGPSVLALGSQLKNSFCLTRENQAFVSQYIGDLDNPGNRQYLKQTIDHLGKLVKTPPEAIITDLHPDFFGLELAKELAELHQIPLFQVQHHHAHAAAVMAENQITTPTIAITLDGLGYGTDGTIWGGELLQVNPEGTFERLGNFKTLQLPGGDQASRQPWRIALGFLLKHQPELADKKYAQMAGFQTISQMIKQELNCPLTSSAGRLFDTAASLLGLSHHNSYEAESAMVLEACARQYETESTEQSLYDINDDLQLDFRLLLLHLANLDNTNKNQQQYGAMVFHKTIANAVFEWVVEASHKTGINQVVLSGGCWLNSLLNDLVTNEFENTNLDLHQAISLSPNDSGLCLGQAWIGQQLLTQQ